MHSILCANVQCDVRCLEMGTKEKPPLNIVGDVGGRIAIVVDDLIDDVEVFTSVAQVLKDRGAYKVYVMATHGLLSAEAPRLLDDSEIDEVRILSLLIDSQFCSR